MRSEVQDDMDHVYNELQNDMETMQSELKNLRTQVKVQVQSMRLPQLISNSNSKRGMDGDHGLWVVNKKLRKETIRAGKEATKLQRENVRLRAQNEILRAQNERLHTANPALGASNEVCGTAERQPERARAIKMGPTEEKPAFGAQLDFLRAKYEVDVTAEERLKTLYALQRLVYERYIAASDEKNEAEVDRSGELSGKIQKSQEPTVCAALAAVAMFFVWLAFILVPIILKD